MLIHELEVHKHFLSCFRAFAKAQFPSFRDTVIPPLKHVFSEYRLTQFLQAKNIVYWAATDDRLCA